MNAVSDKYTRRYYRLDDAALNMEQNVQFASEEALSLDEVAELVNCSVCQLRSYFDGEHHTDMINYAHVGDDFVVYDAGTVKFV